MWAEISGQSGKRSKSRIRRLARKRSIFEIGVTFPKAGEIRAFIPVPDVPGAKAEDPEGITRVRVAWGCPCPFFAGFAGMRPVLPRPRAELDVADAIVTFFSRGLNVG